MKETLWFWMTHELNQSNNIPNYLVQREGKNEKEEDTDKHKKFSDNRHHGSVTMENITSPTSHHLNSAGAGAIPEAKKEPAVAAAVAPIVQPF